MWLARRGPEPSPMSIDDGTTNGQSHTRSAGLRGVEGLENAFAIVRINARTGVAHRDEDPCLVLFSPDRQLSCPRLDRAHCFNRVQDQVQDHLLKLNAIPQNRKQSLRKPSLDRNAIPECHALRQYNHFVDCRVEIKTLFSWRRFLDLLSDAIDDFSGSIRVRNHTGEGFPDLAQVWRLKLQKIQGRPGVVARA